MIYHVRIKKTGLSLTLALVGPTIDGEGNPVYTVARINNY